MPLTSLPDQSPMLLALSFRSSNILPSNHTSCIVLLVEQRGWKMSGLEPAIISAIAKVAAPVLPIAIKAIQDALKKRQIRDKDVKTLKSQLSYIQGIVRDTQKTIRSANDPSGRIQSWAGNLRCLAYDIEDLIAGHRAETMTGAKLNGKITIIQSLVDFINSCPEFMKIPDEAFHQAGASSSASTAQITHSNPLMEKDFPLADLVGKEEHLREFLDLLQRPNMPLGTADLNLKVMAISVVGFGGIGETKLCHKVYRDVERNSKFSLYAFVSAAGMDGSMVLEEIIRKFLHQEDPQDSNGGLFHRVLQKIRGDPDDKVQHYIPRLAQHLQNKRYFIVVDGVESEELIEFIASVFPENNMGSRIIIGMMTAVGKDAERCVGHMPKMRPLEDERSVTCFLNEALQRPTFIRFQEEDRSSSCLQKICDGVPLALVSVCEVRRGSVTAAAVEEACRKLRREQQDRWPHRMPVVLPQSYDCLHTRSVGSCQNQYIPYLQACLLYFAMFPRGKVIKKGSLIRRWQAEGQQFGGSNQAAQNLKTLVDRNFVWPLHMSMNQDYQHAKTCQPPGVVLDYISGMSETEEFILKSCPREDLTPNCGRRLCLHPPKEDEPEPAVITDGCVPPRLRTLAVSWGYQQACWIAECEQLRVLDLQSYKGLEATELEEICQKLRLLKYLSLLPDIITEVPSSISNLQCLETLELGEVKHKSAVLVPIEVIRLPCLKHLIGKFELIDILHGMPIRFWPKVLVQKEFKNSNLERISGFFTRRGQGFPSLMCHMRQLRKVKIWFYSDAEAKYLATYLPKAITKFLKDDNVPRSLSLDFQDCPSPRELLRACLAKASGKLDSLKLSGKNLSKIHLFVITYNTKLTGITKLCLSRWETITLDAAFLHELSKLSHLKYLNLDADTIKGPYDDNPRAGNNQEKVVIESRHIENVQRWYLVAKQTLPDIQVNPIALQRLVSLHLISEKPDYCPSANIICKANGQAAAPLMNLKEVSLNSTVPEHLRNPWHEAARDHPNTPQILFVQDTHRAE